MDVILREGELSGQQERWSSQKRRDLDSRSHRTDKIPREIQRDWRDRVIFRYSSWHSQDGESVTGLDMEAYEDKAEKVFSFIAEDMKKRPGIIEVLIHHVTGHLEVGDLIFVVIVAGSNRKYVFPTLTEAVERIKKEATIWKKETLSTGESYWVEYE